jgi:hypothetical protein
MRRTVFAKLSGARPNVSAESPSSSRMISHCDCRHRGLAVFEQRQPAPAVLAAQAFEEPHHAVAYWARLWGFSTKTVRDWFRDEYGPGILRQPNTGRRSKRDYTTTMISASAAARVYSRHTAKELIH